MNSGLGEHAAPNLPTESERLLNKVQSGEVLGASRQLHVLGECLVSLVAARSGDPHRLSADVAALDGYVRRTRGASSQAVANGLTLMISPSLVSAVAVPIDGLGELLLAAVAAFRAKLAEWQIAVRCHAAELLASSGTIFVYDYSSTVSHAVIELVKSGGQPKVFVPEARSLDGGRKYLPDWSELGIHVEFIPDSAIGWALDHSDIALVGAETLSAEGGCYNTIGTAVAAHEARRRQVPLHVLSILLKTHLGTAGGERSTPMLDFLSLSHPGGKPRLPQCGMLSGSFPDIDYTAPADIAGVVTERGPLKPAEVAKSARSLLGDTEQARA